jgi:hypothetical protein
MTGPIVATAASWGIGAIWGKVKWYVLGAAALAIVTAVSLGVLHYTSLVSEVGTLKANAAKYEGAIAEQKRTIEAAEKTVQEWKGSMAQYQTDVAEANRVANDARAQARRTEDAFRSHDLTALSKGKPGLVEHAINSGTVDAARLLRCATGGRDQDCPGEPPPAPGPPTAPRPRAP